MKNFEQVAFTLCFIFYSAGILFYCWYTLSCRSSIGLAATLTAGAGLAANTLAMTAHAVSAGRLPLTSGYEFLLDFAWGIVLLYLVFEFRTKIKIVGILVLPVAWAILGIIAVLMPASQKVTGPLMPALKSNWLTIHVVTVICAYGGFTLAFGLAFMLLWGKRLYSAFHIDPNQLDRLCYRAIAFGFLLLTMAIISGSIWAEKAWGSYWSWDPKETWSLVTWLIYGAYLHARKTREWQGRPAAVMAVAGFLAMLFTFFGVNYMLPGLHSYSQLAIGR